MSLLKQLLMEKKIIEAQEDVDSFIENNGVEPGSVHQRLEFETDVYENIDLVNDFLKAHYLDCCGMVVEKSESMFIATFFDPIAFVDSTLKRIKIRDGVFLVVGILRPIEPDNPILYKQTESKSIKLSADIPYLIEIAKIIDGFHQSYGKVQITKEDLRKFKENFDKKVYGTDLAIDFDHETREAAGWIKEVFLSDDSTTLLGVVRWTPKGALALSEREFRYFSPEFSKNWVHPHTGVSHGPTLHGGALVNRPFLKMEPIVELKNGKENEMSETISLSDHKQKVSDFEKQISELKLSENTLANTNKGLKEENVKLSDELKKLKDDMALKEKQEKHQKLFSEGKINKAQLDALNEGKDMMDVLALSDKMNLKPSGDGGADNTETVQLSDKEKELCSKMGMSHEDFIKYNKEAN